MSQVSYNPLAYGDIDNIISAYTRYNNRGTPDDLSDDTIDSFIATKPASVKVTGNGNSSVINDLHRKLSKNTISQVSDAISKALYVAKMQEWLDEARASVETLYSYGTNRSSSVVTDIGPLKNIEFNNTAVTLFEADNIGEALGTLVADCIPCKDRVIALLAFNPSLGLADYFTAQWKTMMQFIQLTYDLFFGEHSVGVMADICSLFKFLSFMCLPDLFAIFTMLGQLIAKYLIDQSDIEITWQAILGKIAGPAFQPLAALIDQFFQLVMAPIECVAAALDSEIQKVENTTELFKNADQKAKEPKKPAAEPLSSGLKRLKKRMEDGIEIANASLKSIDDTVKEYLQLKLGTDQQMFDITSAIKEITQLIGLVQAVIMAIQQGGIWCSGDKTDESLTGETLDNFVNNYMKNDKDIDIVSRNGQIKIQPKNANLQQVDKVLATYEKSLADSGQAVPVTKRQSELIVEKRNCLYSVSDTELEQVKDFLGNFQTATIG